eukprot:6094727-Amphidinium_carterae.1
MSSIVLVLQRRFWVFLVFSYPPAVAADHPTGVPPVSISNLSSILMVVYSRSPPRNVELLLCYHV